MLKHCTILAHTLAHIANKFSRLKIIGMFISAGSINTCDLALTLALAGFQPNDLLKYITRDEATGTSMCSICSSFFHKSPSNVRNHIESKHFTNTFVYNCPHCGKECSSHQALLKHKSRSCPAAKQLQLQQN